MPVNQTNDAQSALKKLEDLRFKFKNVDLSKKNEASTRLEIIDEILMILNWDKADFNPELYSNNSGYLDYLLKKDNLSQVVVEAKRYETPFWPKVRLKNSSIYDVSYLKSAFGNDLPAVILQTEKYGLVENVSFGVITNGADWIALQLIPSPGIIDKDRKAIYFGSIFDESFNFHYFFNLLSKDSIQNLKSELTRINQKPISFNKKLSSTNTPLVWERPPSDLHLYLEEFYYRAC